MILATQTDVETRLGRDLTDDETDRLPGLLEEASAIVEGYVGVTYTEDDEIPSSVAVVVSKIVARCLATPTQEGPASLQAGPFQVTYRDNTNLWLSKSDKLMLRNIGGGFTSVRLKSERA